MQNLYVSVVFMKILQWHVLAVFKDRTEIIVSITEEHPDRKYLKIIMSFSRDSVVAMVTTKWEKKTIKLRVV